MISDEVFQSEARHISGQVMGTPFVRDPFPHIYVPDFFSPDFYDRIMKHLPPLDDYEAFLDAQGRPFGKYQVPLHVNGANKVWFDQLPPDRKLFWSRFERHCLGDGIHQVIIEKFAPLLILRFGAALAGLPLYFDSRLSIDSKGARSFLHTDPPDFVITFLVYLPEDDSLEGTGTRFYRPRNPAYFDVGNGPPEDETNPEFREVVAVPFRPNTMVAFFKSARSFHGVDAITDPSVQRRTLLIHAKVSLPYFKDLYGADIYEALFLKRTMRDFQPFRETLRRGERAYELGLIGPDGFGKLPQSA